MSNSYIWIGPDFANGFSIKNDVQMADTSFMNYATADKLLIAYNENPVCSLCHYLFSANPLDFSIDRRPVRLHSLSSSVQVCCTRLPYTASGSSPTTLDHCTHTEIPQAPSVRLLNTIRTPKKQFNRCCNELQMGLHTRHPSRSFIYVSNCTQHSTSRHRLYATKLGEPLV